MAGLKLADDSPLHWVNGICDICKKPYKRLGPKQKYCSPKCRIEAFQRSDLHPWYYQREYVKKLQNQVYSLFGNKCAFCGEEDPIVLTIDHIEAVGKHRKQTVTNYLEILSSSDYATKYQLLCRNCNWRKMIEKNERNPKEPEFVTYHEFADLVLEVHKLQVGFKEPSTKQQASPSSSQDLEMLLKRVEQYLPKIVNDDGKVNARDLRLILLEKEGLQIGCNKSYDLKRIIERRLNSQGRD